VAPSIKRERDVKVKDEDDLPLPISKRMKQEYPDLPEDSLEDL